MQNIETAIKKAMIAFEQNGQIVANDFTSVSKMVALGTGTEREIKDYLLSQFACYLVAQNGGPRKPEIAAAHAYFAISTRQFEIAQLLADQEERIKLREHVSDDNCGTGLGGCGKQRLSSNEGSFACDVFSPTASRKFRSVVGRRTPSRASTALILNSSYPSPGCQGRNSVRM